MIETTGVLGTIIPNDRLYRDNGVADTGQRRPAGDEESGGGQGGRTEDTVTLSAQAVALSRNVSAASGNEETAERADDTARTGNREDEQRPRNIDIMA